MATMPGALQANTKEVVERAANRLENILDGELNKITDFDRATLIEVPEKMPNILVQKEIIRRYTTQLVKEFVPWTEVKFQSYDEKFIVEFIFTPNAAPTPEPEESNVR